MPSTSPKQQRLMAYIYSKVKEGKKDELTGKAREIADSMSLEQLKHYTKLDKSAFIEGYVNK
jgi:hypothetical protein